MPHSRQASNGLVPLLTVAFALMAMSILKPTQDVRIDGSATETTEADPKERGRAYEDHVFDDERLPAQVQAEGGTLKLHPRIFPPRVTLPARYYKAPSGFDGGALLDPQPYAKAALKWRSLLKGGFRVPDAIASYSGRQVLYELKCPSPWLTFGEGEAWAAKMQAGFASQALAFFAWAARRPDRRSVFYGFCGEMPPWADAILGDIVAQYPLVPYVIEDRFFMHDFEPAHDLVHRATRDAMLTLFEEMAPEAIFGESFDRMKD